ncbi:MAG: hypothetical protein ACI8WT_004094 [Clostridium sp.]|jgi:hypothetical protein
MKNKFKHLSVVLVIITMLSGCSSKKSDVVTTADGIKYTQDDIDKEAMANKKLSHILNVKTSKITLQDGKFIGTIQNTNNDVSVRDITIDLGIYNANNEKIGDEYIYVYQIDCGETYRINQAFYDYKYKDATTFKLVDEKININE